MVVVLFQKIHELVVAIIDRHFFVPKGWDQIVPRMKDDQTFPVLFSGFVQVWHLSIKVGDQVGATMRYAKNRAVACGFFEADHHFPVPLPNVGDQGKFPCVFAKIGDPAGFVLFQPAAGGGGDRSGKNKKEDEEEGVVAIWDGHEGGSMDRREVT